MDVLSPIGYCFFFLDFFVIMTSTFFFKIFILAFFAFSFVIAFMCKVKFASFRIIARGFFLCMILDLNSVLVLNSYIVRLLVILSFYFL